MLTDADACAVCRTQVIVDNMDALLDEPPFSAVAAMPYSSRLFNSGVFVYEPSVTLTLTLTLALTLTLSLTLTRCLTLTLTLTQTLTQTRCSWPRACASPLPPPPTVRSMQTLALTLSRHLRCAACRP